MKRRNPKGRHLAGATPKQQRQYEEIKRSERARGAPLAEAKRIAAATVHARARRRNRGKPRKMTMPPSLPLGTHVRFKEGYEHGGRTGVITYVIPVHTWRPPSTRFWTYHVQLDGIRGGAGEVTAQERRFDVIPKNPTRNPTIEEMARYLGLSAGEIAVVKARKPDQAKLRAIYRRRKVLEATKGAASATPKQQATAQKGLTKVDTARRSWLSRLGTRLRLAAQTKTYKVSARDLNRCKKRVVKIRSRHETDALAKAHSQLGAGYDQLKVTNPTRKKSKKRNPLFKLYIEQKFFGKQGGYTQLVEAESAEAVKEMVKRRILSDYPDAKMPAAKSRILKNYKIKVTSVKSNPTRKGMRKYYGAIKRQSKEFEKKYPHSGQEMEMELRKHARRYKGIERRRRNPSPAEIRKDFAGSVGHGRDLYFPKGTPHGLAKLGRLELIQTEDGPIRPVHGAAWLCADTSGRLHIGSTTPAPLIDGPRHNFGEVKRIEYDTPKPHLGYPNPIIWNHKLGEISGVRPTLHADGKGGLVFRGGNYYLTRRGIED